MDGWGPFPPRMVGTSSSLETRTSLMRQINGKDTSWINTKSIGHKFKIHLGPESKLRLCGLFGAKMLSSLSERRRLHRPLSLCNAFFVFPIRANRSNIRFGIVFKQRWFRDWSRLLCMNFAGYAQETMTPSIGSKFCLGKESLRDSAK